MPRFTHAELGARWESEPPRDATGVPACVLTADQARVAAAPERPSQRSRDPHSLPQRGLVSAWPGGTASPWRVATGQLQD